MSHNVKKPGRTVKKIRKIIKQPVVIFHLLQFSSIHGEPLQTLYQVQKILSHLSVNKGDWLVFPEMWPCGFELKDQVRHQKEHAISLAWLKQFAKKFQCYLAGSMLEIYHGKKYNSAYIIGPNGRLLSRYRKIHLFKLGQEHQKYHPGEKVITFQAPWGKIGLAICFDLRFPELFRHLSKRGVEIVLVPSAWPTERLDHFLTLLKARAIENLSYMIGVNKVGKGGRDFPGTFGGHSAVFGPWGEKLGELGAKAGVLTIKLDLSRCKKIRKQYPFLDSRILG